MTQTKLTVTASLTGKWKPYPAYKDSGVEWLGEIPEHWEVKRLKYVAPASTAKLIEKPDDLPYLGLENIESKTGRLLLDTPVENVESTVGIFDKGNVLFGKLRPYLAKVVCVDFRGVCTTELLVLQPNDVVNGKFLFYRLLSEDFVKLVNSLTYGTKMPRVSSEQIGNLAVQLPPFPEQNAIITYLDRETARISALIAKKERLVELLQEKRAALISHAVTKGLDPTVSMKDSGVEWLGEIPAHWEVKRLKHLTHIVSKGTTPTTIGKEFLDEGIRFIKAENVSNGRVTNEPATFIDAATNDILRRSILYAHDILMVIAGATTGKVGIIYYDQLPANTNQAVAFIRLKGQNHSRFLIFWLGSPKIQEQVWLKAVQAAQPNLSLDDIRNFIIPIPPASEEIEIIKYLERETSKIDALVSRIRGGIEKLLIT